MKNRCEDCAFFKRQHYLTSTLLHGVMYICAWKGKTIRNKDERACKLFVKNEEDQKLKERAE